MGRAIKVAIFIASKGEDKMLDARKRDLVFHIIIISFGVVMLYPLIWMINASFRPEVEIFSETSLFSNLFCLNLTLNNYIIGWQGIAGNSFGRFLLNSGFIALMGIIANVLSCSMAAFAFSKLEFRFKKILFWVMLTTLMLPFHVRLIPQYILFHRLGWIDTYLPLIIPRFFAVEGFFVFLLVQFMRGISNELLEAPRIDGCGTFQIYLNFIIPLSIPSLITVSILTFIWTWNDFFSQLIYISTPANFTVALALRMFVDPTGRSTWGALFAMSTISLLPLMFVFIAFQRYLLEGITSGGIKE